MLYMTSTTNAEVFQLTQAKLVRGKRGTVKPNLENVKIILETDSRWYGALAWDEFQNTVVKLRPPPCGGATGAWADIDTVRVADWVSTQYKLDIPKHVLVDGIRLAADHHTINSPADWFRSLTWDGIARIDGLFIDYFGGPDSPYAREVGKNFMIGAVMRVLSPGVPLHEVVILEGKQGAGKSRGVRVLFGSHWFSDTPLDVGNKDAYLAMRGKMCIEMGELSSMSKADVNAMKVFVASPTDRFRAPYGREPEDIPRRCVFIGTTNDAEYLQDATGNRRWLPVMVGKVNWDAITRDRTQLWAEAFARAAAGEDFWLSPLVVPHALQERGNRQVDDPWRSLIETWLEGQLGPVTTAMLLEDAVGKAARDCGKADQIRVGRIIQALGWVKRQSTGGKRAYHQITID